MHSLVLDTLFNIMHVMRTGKGKKERQLLHQIQIVTFTFYSKIKRIFLYLSHVQLLQQHVHF
ncbi:hypothetical protein VIAQ111709_12925 [Vibrio aquimaris]|uniref:Uncharacterized protein n=1 Tax=Vibrio aquimaris TaxID=2587862 RepID=A0A5P9CPW7_9VIBR|nr:hypothetical protein FIV01_15720 [Vibrio aquimaris]